MKARNIITFFLLLIITRIYASAANEKYDVAFYDRWVNESSRTLTDKAQTYTSLENMTDSAVVCYTIVANRYYERSQDEKEQILSVNAMANLGYLYCCHYFDYQKAYGYLRQALDIAEKNKLRKPLSYIYLNLAVLYATYEELTGHDSYSSEILRYLHKSLNTSISAGETRAALYCLNDIVDIKFNDKKPIDSELRSFRKLKVTAKADIPLYKYTQLMLQGISAYANKDYAKALSCFEKMETCIGAQEKGNADMLRFKAMRYRSSVLFAMGKNTEAVSLLDSVAAEAERTDMLHVKVWIYKILYNHYSQDGEKRMADELQLKYFKAKEALSQSGHIEDISKMRFLYELKTVNDRVKELARERRQQSVMFMAGLAVALIVIVGLLLLLRYYRRQKNYIQRLYDKNMAILQLKDSEAADVPTEKYAASGLDDQSKEKLKQDIAKVLADTSVICSPDFTIKQLCDMIGSNTTYVSQVVNEKYGMNFKTLLNERRIVEACRRLDDVENYGSLTIEAIATSVGFKSRTNFALVFKRYTGLSASEFQRAARHKM